MTEGGSMCVCNDRQGECVCAVMKGCMCVCSDGEGVCVCDDRQGNCVCAVMEKGCVYVQ